MNYKKLAIKAFWAENFDLAKNYFSLEFNKTGAEILPFLINLCDLAKQNAQEAKIIFELVICKVIDNKNEMDDLNELVEILESNLDAVVKNENTQNAIDYNDFKKLVRKSGDFKQVFENIMFSTRVVISKRDDMIEFLGHLAKNGYQEICFEYLESARYIFPNDKKINDIINEISKKGK